MKHSLNKTGNDNKIKDYHEATYKSSNDRTNDKSIHDLSMDADDRTLLETTGKANQRKKRL